MQASDAVLARIRKLLAVAEHPATPPAEAESAAQAAERMIIKYAIDEALLAARSDVRSKPEVRMIVIEAPYASAKRVILSAVARAHGVRVISHTGQAARATLVGFDSDLRLVDLLFTSLLLQAATGMRRQARSDKAFRRAFLIGFAYEVGDRLRQARSEAVAESGGASTELALRNRDHEVADVLQEHFPRLVTSRISVSDGGGLVAGRRSGATANLTSGDHRLSGGRASIARSSS
ncbi:MAG TPA: DUF2786 domain-containing protein [Mycobacteriales bacterium]|nr:DUF2786 domain-containing protein [Mycobacteriales bacterium]